jgi:hypothetical protein
VEGKPPGSLVSHGGIITYFICMDNTAFSKEQVAQIKEYLADKRDCYGKKAFYVGERWGLRANDIAEHYILKSMK